MAGRYVVAYRKLSQSRHRLHRPTVIATPGRSFSPPQADVFATSRAVGADD